MKFNLEILVFFLFGIHSINSLPYSNTRTLVCNFLSNITQHARNDEIPNPFPHSVLVVKTIDFHLGCRDGIQYDSVDLNKQNASSNVDICQKLIVFEDNNHEEVDLFVNWIHQSMSTFNVNHVWMLVVVHQHEKARLLAQSLTINQMFRVHAAVFDLQRQQTIFVNPLENECREDKESSLVVNTNRVSLATLQRHLLAFKEDPNQRWNSKNRIACNLDGNALTVVLIKSINCNFDKIWNKSTKRFSFQLHSSIEINLIQLLASKFNFTLNFVDADGHYGKHEKDGPWTGAIGHLVNHVGLIHATKSFSLLSHFVCSLHIWRCAMLP